MKRSYTIYPSADLLISSFSCRDFNTVFTLLGALSVWGLMKSPLLGAVTIPS